jgi:hypothetical protein
MIKLNGLIKDYLLYEGLIHSVSISEFEDYVNRWVISSDKFEIIADNKKIKLNFKKNLNVKELDNLLKFINTLGWFVSAYLVGDNIMKWKKFDKDGFVQNDINKKLYSFQVEAKFDTEFNKYGFDYLYHVTPSINDNKIGEIGLVPKSRNKISYHPERIYFTPDIQDLDAIANQFHKLDSSVTEFSYYEVNIKNATKNNSGIRLFEDPNFKGGIYTLSNIRKQDLKFLRKEII